MSSILFHITKEETGLDPQALEIKADDLSIIGKRIYLTRARIEPLRRALGEGYGGRRVTMEHNGLYYSGCRWDCEDGARNVCFSFIKRWDKIPYVS